MSINKIKFDKERYDKNGGGFGNPYYVYEFQATWVQVKEILNIKNKNYEM